MMAAQAEMRWVQWGIHLVWHKDLRLTGRACHPLIMLGTTSM